MRDLLAEMAGVFQVFMCVNEVNGAVDEFFFARNFNTLNQIGGKVNVLPHFFSLSLSRQTKIITIKAKYFRSIFVREHLISTYTDRSKFSRGEKCAHNNTHSMGYDTVRRDKTTHTTSRLHSGSCQMKYEF